ncbi:GNAT family protein [Glycomyces sp. NPDC047010]|uniref:GNAT family N-acetyltransferase n=1 Tax=Glycomyces sp. NPDC047010 TaxID=3155023 RepID=UPI0033C91548
MTSIRPVRSGDAPAIAELRRKHREYLAPWEPARSEEHFTDEHVEAGLAAAVANAEAGTGHTFAILDEGRLVGQVMLNSVIRGAFQSCSIGYWVAESEAGRGIATEAVRLAKAVAFGELGLHRVQGETLVHNTGSQKVLERNGFVRYGLAERYLKIAGRWQDHVLYQVIAPDGE